MAEWKKVIVSGSDASLHSLYVGASQLISSSGAIADTRLTGSFTGSFVGDGSGLTGIATSIYISSSNGGSGSLDLKEGALIVSGSTNEIDVTFDSASGKLEIGLVDNPIISGSLTVNENLTVTGSVYLSSSIYQTDGIINPITASWAMNASTTALNSGLSLHVGTAATTWTLTHNLGTAYPLVEIWDDTTNKIIIPDEITSLGLNAIQIDFTTPVSGWANISRAGHVVSGSTLWQNLIAGDSGSQVIITDGTLGVTGSFAVTGSDGTPAIVDFTGTQAISGSVFSGSFVGDGSGLTGVASELMFSGSGATVTSSSINLKTDSLTFSGSNGIVTTVSASTVGISVDELVLNGLEITGSISVTGSLGTGSIIDFTGTQAISGSVFSGSFVGDGSGLTGIATSIAISGSEGGSGSIDLKESALIVSGSTNEIAVLFNSASGTLEVGLVDNPIISGSLTVNENLYVTGSVYLSSSIYQTDGIVNPITASWAMNASTTALNSGMSEHYATATGSWLVTHNLNTEWPLVTVWDDTTNKIIEPNEVTSLGPNQIRIDFTTPISGWVNVSRAGHVVSGSTLWQNLIAGDSGSQVVIEDGTLGITGSLSVTGSNGTPSIINFTGAQAISGSIFSGSFVGDGSGLTGVASTLLISASSAVSGAIDTTGSLDLKTESLIISGTLNEVEVTYADATKTIQIGLPDNVNITNNLVVGGDFTVLGSASYMNTTEILVEDRFILLASGAASPVDGGIIIQSTGSVQGYSLGIDASAERWALQQNLSSPATSLTPDSYVTTTQFGLANTKPLAPTYGSSSFGYGNIWVSTDNSEIYIWA